MKTMKYKGYSARIEYSDEDGCFVVHIAGIRDIVGFHGEAVGELRAAFEEAVDDYLETCKKTGKQPQKPYPAKGSCCSCSSCRSEWKKYKPMGCGHA